MKSGLILGTGEHMNTRTKVPLKRSLQTWTNSEINPEKKTITYTEWFFLTAPPPHFSTKKKTANQPTTAAVPENHVTEKGLDWLLSDFLFGTEMGGG